MNKWLSYDKARVMFTQNHWMTTEVFVLYLDWITDIYKGKRIGLIVDHAPAHDPVVIQPHVDAMNERKKVEGTYLVLGWIEKGLTCVYQPGDVGLNKTLKDNIREQYQKYKSKSVETLPAGSKFVVSREKLLEFIEEAFDQVNRDQVKKFSIYKTFKKCGLIPWEEDLSEFIKHLDELSQYSVYNQRQDCSAKLEEASQNNQKALVLK
jgi:hypothetical protein